MRKSREIWGDTETKKKGVFPLGREELNQSEGEKATEECVKEGM